MTVKVPSTYPLVGRKKNWMPLPACASVRVFGSVGLSVDEPAAVEVKSLSASFT